MKWIELYRPGLCSRLLYALANFRQNAEVYQYLVLEEEGKKKHTTYLATKNRTVEIKEFNTRNENKLNNKYG